MAGGVEHVADYTGVTSVKTFGLTLMLRDDPDAMAAYRRFHQAVWPEVTARMRECGVEGMQIFLRGTRLFMYLVTNDEFDPSRDFARINEDPTSQRWNALMAELQARAPEASPDEWWARMDLVFDLDWPQHRTPPAASQVGYW
jgi:L-rhamnose mutarotase